MKVIIDIPEKEYKEIVDNKQNKSWDMTHYERVIAKGIPIPKKHGDLIDKKDVRHCNNACETCFARHDCSINNAPIILKAETR